MIEINLLGNRRHFVYLQYDRSQTVAHFEGVTPIFVLYVKRYHVGSLLFLRKIGPRRSFAN